MANPIHWQNVGGLSSSGVSVQATKLFNDSLQKLTEPIKNYNDNKVARLQSAFKQEREDNTAKILQARLLGTEYTPPNNNYDKMKVLEGTMKVDAFKSNQENRQLSIDKLKSQKPYWGDNAMLDNKVKRIGVDNAGLTNKKLKFDVGHQKESYDITMKGKKASLRTQQLNNKRLNIANGFLVQDHNLKVKEINSRITKNQAQATKALRVTSQASQANPADIVPYLVQNGKKTIEIPRTKEEIDRLVRSQIDVKAMEKMLKPKADSSTPKSVSDMEYQQKQLKAMRSKNPKKALAKLQQEYANTFDVTKTDEYKKVYDTLTNYYKSHGKKATRRLTPSEVVNQAVKLSASIPKSVGKAMKSVADIEREIKKAKDKNNDELTKSLLKIKEDAMKMKRSKELYDYKQKHKRKAE